MYKLLLVFVLAFGNVMAQDIDNHIKRILSFQEDLNKKFASEDTSPLISKEIKQFESLDFFNIDTLYSVVAKFVRTPYETPFIMSTTTGREPLYVKYGEVHFTLNKTDVVLNIYQNQELMSQAEYVDYLFLPFTDLTNGESSYAGGRFIDLKIPEDEYILIDFNTAYNPYCAYNDRYSCPIPPEENHLDLKIMAGVKKYNKYPKNR